MRLRVHIAAVLSVCCLTAACLAGRGWCGSLSDLLDSAGRESEKSRYREAFEHLRDAEWEIWQQMRTMVARRALLVEQEPAPFQPYVPKPDNRYRPGESICLYVEPAGYVINTQKDVYTLSLSADYLLLDDAGKVLLGTRDFVRWKDSSRRPVMDFPLYFTYDFTGLAPGAYTIETTVKDAYSDRRVKLATPVVIVE